MVRFFWNRIVSTRYLSDSENVCPPFAGFSLSQNVVFLVQVKLSWAQLTPNAAFVPVRSTLDASHSMIVNRVRA